MTYITRSELLMKIFIPYFNKNNINYITVEYMIKYLEKSFAYIHYMPRFYPILLKYWKILRFTCTNVEWYSRQTFWLLHFTGYPAWLQRSAKSATAVQKHSQSPPLSHLFNRIHPNFTGLFFYVRYLKPQNSSKLYRTIFIRS